MMVFQTQKALPEKWMKASVVGSLWAVVEILLGSLLHNLKIPFAGSILSFFTVFLLIAFFQLWKFNGLIWRAGLVCALMKSLSPSAVILGPMIGILSEALILDLVIRSFGKNLLAYTLGGALAVFSALIHKAVSLLILYSWDIVVIIENMVLFSMKQLRIEGFSPSWLLLTLIAVYLLSGALAGVFGFVAGNDYLKHEYKTTSQLNLKSQVQSSLFNHSKKGGHSLVVLLMIIVMLVGTMILISRAGLAISTIFSLVFIVIIALKYGANMRFLKKPALWIQLMVIILFSAIFFQGFSVGGILHIEGWVVGLKIVFRAIVLLSAFSAISCELKNPLVKSILYRRGFRNLYQSLELAFSCIPGLVEAFSSQASKVMGFGKLIRILLGNSQLLLDGFRETEKQRPSIFVITGQIHEGKSTMIRKVVAALQQKEVDVVGFFSVAHTGENGQKSYSIEEIATGKRKLLCTESFLPDAMKTSRFYFSDEGFEWGCQIIVQATTLKAELVVIDEIGPVEIGGKGWAGAIEQSIGYNPVPHLWVIREKLLEVALRKWNVGDVYIFKLSDSQPEEIVNCIHQFIGDKNNM